MMERIQPKICVQFDKVWSNLSIPLTSQIEQQARLHAQQYSNVQMSYLE